MRGTTGTVAGLLLVAAMAGMGATAMGAGTSEGGDATIAAADIHVHIQGFQFQANSVTITAGESVEWDNHDAVTHTVTANDFSWDSGDLGQDDAYTLSFTDPGTYAYFCVYHAGMQGTVIVLEDPEPAPDLVVAAVAAEETTPGVEQRIDVTVRNRGSADAGATVVAVTYSYQGERHAIGEVDVPALGPGGAATVSLTWDTVGKVGDFALRAEADAGGAVDEDDEGNNAGTGVASVLLAGIDGIDLLDPL